MKRATSVRAGWVFWALPLLFLILFFFYPLSSIFSVAWEAIQLHGLEGGREIILRSLLFTTGQAALSTLLTVIIGLPAAHLFARFNFRGKRIIQVLITLPFIVPTIVAAAGYNALLGPRGWLNELLMILLNLSQPPVHVLNTLGIILIAHIFYNTAIIIRVVGSAWEKLNPSIEDAARVLGASDGRLFTEITLPIIRPSIMAAALLVFLFDFTSFGVILLLGGPAFATMEVEIYYQTMSMLNLPLAGILSIIQFCCTFLIAMLYSRFGGAGSVPLMPRLKGESVKSFRNWKQRFWAGGLLTVLLIIFVLPLFALGLRSVTDFESVSGKPGKVETHFTTAYFKGLFVNQRKSAFYVPPVRAAINSLLIAGGTVCIALPLGYAGAHAFSRGGKIRQLMDPIIMLPLGGSAVTLGLGFLLVFNHPPLDVRSSPWLIPIAHSMIALPFVIRTLQPAIESIPSNLRQAAAVLGAPPKRVWMEVDLPLLSRAIVVSGIFAFSISLGEFGATSFLARPEFPTLPVAIYQFISQPGPMNYGQAMAMATILLLLCGAGVFLMDALESR